MTPEEVDLMREAVASVSRALVDNTFDLIKDTKRAHKIKKIITNNIQSMTNDEKDFIIKKYYDPRSSSWRSTIEINDDISPISPIAAGLINKGVLCIVNRRSADMMRVPLIAGITIYNVISASLNPMAMDYLSEEMK